MEWIKVSEVAGFYDIGMGWELPIPARYEEQEGEIVSCGRKALIFRTYKCITCGHQREYVIRNLDKVEIEKEGDEDATKNL